MPLASRLALADGCDLDGYLMRSSSFETNQDVDTFAALQIPERLLIWGCRTARVLQGKKFPMD
jgi:hypothetical protein